MHSNKRAKVLHWILPVYAFVFLFYAAFGINRKSNEAVQKNEEGIQRHLLSVVESPSRHRNCTPAAIEEFPDDFLTQEERARGGLVLHVLVSVYLFYALAIVCDQFFVPSLECLCKRLELPTDVAGATFMAMGTSAPELFTSVIGAFITEGDIGVGTIVGSAVFNILAVLSVCGLLAGIVVPLDWWPMTRDSFAYVVTVISLIFIITDQRVTWIEAAIMLVLYCLYIVMMFFNARLERLATAVARRCGCLSSDKQQSHLAVVEAGDEEKPLLSDAKDTSGGLDSDNGYSVTIKERLDDDDDDNEQEQSIWSMPYHGSCQQISWVVMWPANFLFHFTIPDCRCKRWRHWYMLTFFMSIVYIGGLAYLCAWMVTIIGYTIGVPDTVMGLTFLAAGTSVPEAISSVLVCRQGYGNMAVSNILGSNIFDILFCLGFPWLVKAAGFSGGAGVVINSGGIEYSALSLLSTVVFLYAVVILNGWQLNRKLGFSCLVIYILFLVVSNLFELNVFGVVNLPSCGAPSSR